MTNSQWYNLQMASCLIGMIAIPTLAFSAALQNLLKDLDKEKVAGNGR